MKEGAGVAFHDGLLSLGLEIGTVIPLDAVNATHAEALSLKIFYSLEDEDVVLLRFRAQRGMCASVIVGRGCIQAVHLSQTTATP